MKRKSKEAESGRVIQPIMIAVRHEKKSHYSLYVLLQSSYRNGKHELIPFPFHLTRFIRGCSWAMTPVKCLIILSSIALTFLLLCVLISTLSSKVEESRAEFVSSLVSRSHNQFLDIAQVKFTKRVRTSRGFVRGFHVDYGTSNRYFPLKPTVKVLIGTNSSSDLPTFSWAFLSHIPQWESCDFR